METRQSRLVLDLFFCAFVVLLVPMLRAQTQSDGLYYARLNSFGVFGAYSGDSSHMMMGTAQNRKLLFFGVCYNRRLILNRVANWQFSGEIMPVALESDPVVHTVYHETSPQSIDWGADSRQSAACANQSGSYEYTFPSGVQVAYSYVSTCKRQWTMGQALSPAGMQWNFRPSRSLQPFATAHAGYLYSTQPIPVDSAGSFNFTFDVGAGVELYRSRTRSIRAEYRYHHISNGDTANDNPGIDSGLFQISYCFGR